MLVQSVFERSKIEADIKPIEPAIGFIFPYTWHIAIGGMFFIMAAYFIFVLIKLRKKAMDARRSSVTQRTLLYNQLCKHAKRVSESSDVSSNDFVELADLVKKYLGSALKAGNYEFTTEEFLNMTRGQKKLFSKYGEGMSLLLRTADLAKFANYKPKPGELKEIALFMDSLIRDLTA